MVWRFSEVLVSTWILSLMVSVVIAVLWHGLSLQIACVLAGEQAPRFGRAIWVSWLGGLLGAGVSTAWGFTFGLVVSLFLSAWLATAIGVGLQLLTTGAVYKRGLKLSSPASFGVALIHLLLSFGVAAVVGWIGMSLLA